MKKSYIKKQIIKQEGMFENREKLVFDFDELFTDWFCDLSQEDQRDVLKGLSLEDSVISSLLERLANNDHGFWSSKDGKTLIEVLAAAEDTLISRLKWSALSDLNDQLKQFIKDKRSAEHIYWHMYHDPVHSDFFKNWLEQKGIESNFTTNVADEELEEVRKMIAEKLEQLKG